MEIKEVLEKGLEAFHARLGPLEDAVQKLQDIQNGKYSEKDGTKEEQATEVAELLVKQAEMSQKLDAIMASNARNDLKVEGAEEAEYKEAFKELIYSGLGHSHLTEQKKAVADSYKGLSVGSLADGGFWVPKQISDKISTRVFESSPIRQLADVETISSDALTIDFDDNEMAAFWVGELGTRQETSTPQLGQKDIFAHEIYAWPSVSQKLLEDSARDPVQWVTNKAIDKFSRTENTAFVTGNLSDRPRGFLTYAAGTATYVRDQIERVVSGSGTTLTGNGLINLQNSLKEAYQPNAVFLMRRSAFGVVRTLTDSANQYLFGIGIGGLNNAQVMTLLGKPIYFADDMPNVGSGALAVAYGDFKAGYKIVDRVGISVLPDPYTSASGKVLYRFRKRTGGDVQNFEAIKLQVVST